MSESCGYCLVLKRPCSCRRPRPAEKPRCERLGAHVLTAESLNCSYCGKRT